MVIRCERCGTRYDFDDAQLGDAGPQVRCSSCGYVFRATKEATRRADGPTLQGQLAPVAQERWEAPAAGPGRSSEPAWADDRHVGVPVPEGRTAAEERPKRRRSRIGAVALVAGLLAAAAAIAVARPPWLGFDSGGAAPDAAVANAGSTSPTPPPARPEGEASAASKGPAPQESQVPRPPSPYGSNPGSGAAPSAGDATAAPTARAVPNPSSTTTPPPQPVAGDSPGKGEAAPNATSPTAPPAERVAASGDGGANQEPKPTAGAASPSTAPSSAAPQPEPVAAGGEGEGKAPAGGDGEAKKDSTATAGATSTPTPTSPTSTPTPTADDTSPPATDPAGGESEAKDEASGEGEAKADSAPTADATPTPPSPSASPSSPAPAPVAAGVEKEVKGGAAKNVRTARAASLDPKKQRAVKAFLADARRMRNRGHPEAALEIYAQAIGADPANADALAGRGSCYLDLSRYAPAEASFRAALGADAENGAALMGLAETFRYEGRRTEAVKYYEQYLAAHPHGEEAVAARNAIQALKE